MSRHGTSRTGRYRTRCRTARTPSAATQSPTFSKSEYPFLGNNHVVADFNGDGRVDLAGVGGNSAAVRLNTGAGAFGARVDYPVGGPAQDLAAGDFNADGRLDLAVTINDPQIGFSLLTGNGDGTFAAPVNFANTSGFDSPAVVAVDLNNDAKLDVVAAHQIACYTAPCVAALTISVLMGNGDGTFQPAREVEVGRGMAEIAVADFNRDGNKDLVIAGDSSRVYRLYGVGDGTFVQQPTLTLTADTFAVDATDIDVADFNGDAIQDLARRGLARDGLGGGEARPVRTLVVAASDPQDRPMEPEPLIYRDEVTAMLLTLADIKIGIRRIIHLLEDGDDGEEEAQENHG